MATHRLEASPETVHWGFFDAKLPPQLTIDSGDTVTISTVSGTLGYLPKPDSGPDGAAGAAGDPRQGAGQDRRAAHPHRAGGGARRQGRAGARGPHQGGRAVSGLGLQHRAAAGRRAARRLQGVSPDPHPARQAADDRQIAVGPRSRSQAVLRHHGGGAAGRLGHDQFAAAAAERRQHGQQGAGRRHHALSADPHRRRAVLLRRRPRRAGRRRGLHHRDRDRPGRHLRADRARATWRRWNGRWRRRRRMS